MFASNDIAETWSLTKQAQKKLAAAQTKMERSMLNITYHDRKTNTLITGDKNNQKNEVVLGRTHHLKDTMDITTCTLTSKKIMIL